MKRSIGQSEFNAIFQRSLKCGKFNDEYGFPNIDAIDEWMMQKFTVAGTKSPLRAMRENCQWCKKKWHDIFAYNQEGIWECPECGKEIEWGT